MLTSLKAVTYSPISSTSKYEASLNDGKLKVVSSHGKTLEASVENIGDQVTLSLLQNDSEDYLVLVAVEYLLDHNKELLKVAIKGESHSTLVAKYLTKKNGAVEFKRGDFLQLPTLWHRKKDYDHRLENYVTTNEKLHPEREDIQSGYLYSKYIPHLEATISYRVIDAQKDLDIFHEWHNQERVAAFWELKESKEVLEGYIEKLLKDPHSIPVIAEYNGTAIGYFELYWAYEDRLGPYYPSEFFDRGFHFLIGNTEFLGFKNTDALLKTLTHFLFLEEYRTRKIMAEPRSDNVRVLKYVETFTAWKKLYEFDFPHKRAALLEVKREAFFTGDFL